MNDAKVLVKFEGDTKNLDNATSQAKKGLGGIKGFAKGVGGTIAGIAATATAAATAMLVDVTKQSLKARAEMEQNLGGVETLFGKDANMVVENAKKAYKTAGVSANEYMKGVTSFAASLLQSTAGNTKKAAEISDMAFRDMSDNANKFGTDMSAIQNAYQGFAKQNYTMLDNLKLGYGGTKTEMQRLLADAQKLTGQKYDISNLSDVYNAIHVIQKEMGVTGTTAKEATETISGSVGALKAAWDNFLSGAGTSKEVIETFLVAAKNIGNELVKIIPDVANGIIQLINGLLPQIPGMIQKLLPVVIQGIITLTQGLISMLPTLLQMFLSMIIQLVTAIAQALPTMIPAIVDAILGMIPILIDNLPLFIEAGIQLIIGILTGIIQALPTLLGYIPRIIVSIVKALSKLPGMLAKAGFNAIMSLAQAIVNNIVKVANAAKKIGQKVFNTIKTLLSPGGLANIGKNLVTGLWNGIQNAQQWVLDKIKGFGKSIIKGIKSIFGIKSPSKVMFEIGGYIDKGFINGVESMKDDISKAINGTFALSPNVTNSASTHFSPNVNVVNNIEMKQDPLGQMVNNIKTFQGGAKNDYNYGKA